MFTAGAARVRIQGLTLCLLGVGATAALGGCNNNGSYRVFWQFAIPSSPSTSSFQPGDCARVGVAGIAITATKSGNSQAAISVPCGLGFYDGSLGEGSWTLGLVALNATGQPQTANVSTDSSMPVIVGPPSGTTDPVEIHAGQHVVATPSVFLMPLPPCADGVDNDLDGRVDLDDPDCAGNPGGTTECGATDGPSCAKTPPGMPDGGVADAGAADGGAGDAGAADGGAADAGAADGGAGDAPSP